MLNKVTTVLQYTLHIYSALCNTAQGLGECSSHTKYSVDFTVESNIGSEIYPREQGTSMLSALPVHLLKCPSPLLILLQCPLQFPSTPSHSLNPPSTSSPSPPNSLKDLCLHYISSGEELQWFLYKAISQVGKLDTPTHASPYPTHAQQKQQGHIVCKAWGI